MRIRSAPTLFAALVVGAGLALAPASLHAQKKRQRDVVTHDELVETGQVQQDLYAALRNLRPRFLERPPGVRSITGGDVKATAVFLDRKPMGGIETLQSIMASTVDEVRYYEPSRAATEFGPIAEGGAVSIKLLKGDAAAKQPADSASRKP